MSSLKAQILTLFRGFPDRGVYVWSPFVTKVEFRFRHAGLKYAVDCGAPTKGPKGKIPYVDLGGTSTNTQEKDGTPRVLGDSTLIIKKLVEQGRLPDLGKGLDEKDMALDYALKSVLEDKLYFYIVS